MGAEMVVTLHRQTIINENVNDNDNENDNENCLATKQQNNKLKETIKKRL